GAGVATLTVSVAYYTGGAHMGHAIANTARTPAHASGTTSRGDRWRLEPTGSSARPARPPSTPPATAAMKPRIAPSGHSAEFHGSGIQICVQPHSAAKPIVPMSAPLTSPNVTCLRVLT